MTEATVDFLCEFKDPSSSSVNLVFSEFLAEDRGARSFSFRHILAGMTSNIIYIKDRKNQWYNRGVIGLGDDIPSVAISLQKLIAKNGFSQVRCLGTSMGGYAALLFGMELKASSILAMAPQTFLSAPYPRFDQRRHSGEYVDLSIFERPPSPATTVVIGADEPFDLYSLLRLGYWPDLNIRVIKGATHLVARKLNDLNLFRSLLSAFVENGENVDLKSASLERNLGDLQKEVILAAEGMFKNDGATAVLALKSLVEKSPEWAGAHYWLGRALKQEQDYFHAASSLTRAVELNPTLYDAASELSTVLTEQGDWKGALSAALAAWNQNQFFNGVRDRALSNALDAIEGMPFAQRMYEGRQLLDELDLISSHEDIVAHPVRKKLELLVQQGSSTT
ncbi:tetratricopeptide repeat protein [Pseudooceanicola sp. C21-150M6]|uniref:tetratricopeptide repeat protein n=1 Tax=Pseudooceanicola sp. C21-150M6 TaxID=3434355 RepID=UPI003D7FCC51